MSEMEPKVRIPQQKRSIETKNRIFVAAKDQFAKNGFHGTNTKEIASAAGVSVGSFYSYFKDKKELFMAIFREHIEEKIVRILGEHQVDPNNRKESVYRLIKAMLEAHEPYPQFHREVLAMRYSDPEVDAVFTEMDQHSLGHVVRFIEQFRDKLRIEDIHTAARIISAAVEEIICSITIFGEDGDADRLIDGLADMIHRYLFD
ncbi:AcrR family transcriptional regulator [Desulfosarcina alkanivorans]|uniref:AcrR family transcriptional regulator n=1 Tax=Desulfosarcina alkanivorans TaxID=571177 RepID=A0A5K7YRY9_9BACT|nr:TetR/AcrR family transcriptional regulator [Desulfosarcina alkanivorans]BBO70699.1 AcrR family transcriptional regulator [Desulfosarcina alkanivorans]